MYQSPVKQEVDYVEVKGKTKLVVFSHFEKMEKVVLLSYLLIKVCFYSQVITGGLIEHGFLADLKVVFSSSNLQI